MQQLLPVAIRVLPDDDVVRAVTQLCHFFRDLSSKEYTQRDFEALEAKIVPVLCQLEMLFPPTIFTIMLHLCLHLPREARLGGPVVYRYMYPFERMMFKMKKYIRNKSKPAGSICEGWLADECMTFISQYLENVETTLNRPSRNEDTVEEVEGAISVFRGGGKILGAVKMTNALSSEMAIIHRYVLFNCEEMEPFINTWDTQYRPARGPFRPRDQAQARHRLFAGWFKEHVKTLDHQSISEDLRILASGPEQTMEELNGYVVNGYRFHTQRKDHMKQFQNCGVCVTATVTGFASSRDRNPNEGQLDYYGVLQEIVRIRYNTRHVVLFKCKWYDVLNRNSGYKIENGLVLLNSTKLNFNTEPYILASQARQCFYMDDPKDEQWHAAIHTNPRDYYNMGDDDTVNVISCPPAPVVQSQVLIADPDIDMDFCRHDIPPEIVEDKN